MHPELLAEVAQTGLRRTDPASGLEAAYVGGGGDQGGKRQQTHRSARLVIAAGEDGGVRHREVTDPRQQPVGSAGDPFEVAGGQPRQLAAQVGQVVRAEVKGVEIGLGQPVGDVGRGEHCPTLGRR